MPQLVQHLSQGTTLQAGSVILTGTPGGTGYTLDPPQWLRPGDVIEITVGPMTLVNKVIYA